MNKEIFTQRLNDLMEAQELSAEEVARHIHAAQSSVESWKAGRKVPKWDKAFALADLFHVSLAYLMGVEQD